MTSGFGRAVAACLVIGFAGAPLMAQGKPAAATGAAACPSGEGKPTAAILGLTFCSEPARIENSAIGGLQEGTRVASVEPKSQAAEAGFQPGDIVYRVGGAPVNTGAAAVKRLQSLRPGEEAVLNFWRETLPFLIRLRG
jgi:S1-C subfamily serine protease